LARFAVVRLFCHATKEKHLLGWKVVMIVFGGDFSWMKQPGMVITCCADPMRPVVFKIERIDWGGSQSSALALRLSRMRFRYASNASISLAENPA
jgi:hypothetical protein